MCSAFLTGTVKSDRDLADEAQEYLDHFGVSTGKERFKRIRDFAESLRDEISEGKRPAKDQASNKLMIQKASSRYVVS